MELEKGMYVRTELYSISKIIYIEDTNWLEIDKNKGYLIHDETVLKASHTLLGNGEEPCLIEVGDYVNGSKVQEIGEGYVEIEEYSGLNNDMPCVVKAEDIKSIVTKEQFESVAYKVGE